MAVLSLSILTDAPPVLAPHDAAWRNELLDSLALLAAEHYDELQSDHPGARHRVTVLADRIVDRQRQLAELEGRR